MIPAALGWLAVGAYSVLEAVMLVLFFRMAWRDRRVTVQLSFLATMTVFLGLRVAYFVLKTSPDICSRSEVTFVLNRVSFALYFAALLLVLFTWAEQSHRTIIDEHFSFLPGVRRWFFLVCGVVWTYQIVVVAIWLSGDGGREGTPLYDSNILVDECLAFAVAIGFAVYGLRLFFMLRREGQELDLSTSREAALILVGAAVMVRLLNYFPNDHRF